MHVSEPVWRPEYSSEVHARQAAKGKLALCFPSFPPFLFFFLVFSGRVARRSCTARISGVATPPRCFISSIRHASWASRGDPYCCPLYFLPVGSFRAAAAFFFFFFLPVLAPPSPPPAPPPGAISSSRTASTRAAWGIWPAPIDASIISVSGIMPSVPGICRRRATVECVTPQCELRCQVSGVRCHASVVRSQCEECHISSVRYTACELYSVSLTPIIPGIPDTIPACCI